MPLFRRIQFRPVLGAALVAAALACAEQVPTESTDLETRYAKGSGGGGTTTTGPIVSSTVPSSSVRGVTLNVRVLGSGFDRGSTARWAIKGVPAAKVVTNSTTFVSSKELSANITIAADADLTLYDVIVTTASGKPGIGTEAFEVTIQMTDLGNLGVANSEAIAINESGQVAGYSSTQAGGRAFRWQNGVMTNLGVPPGFTSSRAEAINNLGDVAGYAMVQLSDQSWKTVGWVWRAGTGMQTLGGGIESTARGINDAGTVVGETWLGDGTRRIAIWVNGVMQLLPAEMLNAWDINSSGVVAGECSPSSTVGATTWPSPCIWSQANGVSYVAALRGTIGSLLGISDDGSVVGWGPDAVRDSTGLAFVRRGGATSPLFSNSSNSSVGMKISSNGMIAGRDGGAGVVWLASGSQIRLPSPSGSSVGPASDINGNGQIAGYIEIAGRKRERHAVIWSLR